MGPEIFFFRFLAVQPLQGMPELREFHFCRFHDFSDEFQALILSVSIATFYQFAGTCLVMEGGIVLDFFQKQAEGGSDCRFSFPRR